MEEIILENIGKITLKHSKKAKSLILKVKSVNDISVIVPYTSSFIEAEKFAVAKQAWILKTINKFKSSNIRNIVFNENSVFHTQNHKLVFNPLRTENISITVKSDIILFSYPYDINLEEKTIQDFIKKGIIEALRIEAKAYLPERVKFLAKMHGFSYNKLSFRNAKTRWGSCSGINNISLNLHLMRLPKHLSDYIILHELCHTVEKNHGPNFWALLQLVSSNAKTLAEELKKHTTQL